MVLNSIKMEHQQKESLNVLMVEDVKFKVKKCGCVADLLNLKYLRNLRRN